MIKYKNLNISKAIEVEGYKLKKTKNISMFRKILSEFFNSLTRYFDLELSGESNIVFLFFKFQDRQDYNHLFDSIFNSCNYSKSIIKTRNKRHINLLFIYYLFKELKLFFLLNKEYNILHSIFLYIKLIYYFQCLNKFNYLTYSNLVVFSDVQTIENLFVQMANNKEISTTTLQHGLYIDYTNLPNINMLNYKNVQCKNFLAWGKSTEKLIRKYNPAINIKICGKPYSSVTNQKNIDDNILFGIIFDQPMFFEYNLEMLNIALIIAKERNKKVIIRTHPLDDKTKYPVNDLIIYSSNLDGAHFILAHTSSLMYELMGNGYSVFKFKSDIPTQDISDDFVFSNSNELKGMLFKRRSGIIESKRHIEQIGEKSIRIYENAFKEIFNNNDKK